MLADLARVCSGRLRRPHYFLSYRDLFVSRAGVVTFGLYLAPVTPRIVHEFQLYPVGIGEEHRVVTLSIVRIFGGRVEHLDLLAHQEFVERIDVGTRARTQCQVMQTDAKAAKLRVTM